MTPLLAAFGLTAIVLLVSALGSKLVERAPLSFPMIFLGLGFALGQFGALEMDAHNPTLEAVAILSLSLVLFLDAVNLDMDELRRNWRVPFLSLGPGTLLTIAIVTLAARLLIGVSWPEALLLGAILASTDPVVLRDVLRDERIPSAVRRALGIEAGMNDIVVLPIVLVLIAVSTGSVGGAGGWLLFGAQLLLLSPAVGLLVGGGGSYLMGRADARWQIRREYQALYGIGLVLASYFAGQLVGGDGFLAAFFAGLAVTLFNYQLCDCFMEYGETTGEMAMLLAFVLFGAVLSDLLPTVPLLPALALAAVVIVVARPVAFAVVLRKARLSNFARGFIGWFGPRGLASLLLALLVVQNNVPGAEQLLAVVGVVVIISVVAHGASAAPLSTLYARRVAKKTYEEERAVTAAALFEKPPDEVERVVPEQLAALLDGPDPPVVIDVRTRSQYERDDIRIPHSVRVIPDDVAEWAHEQDRKRMVVAYCT